MEFDGDLDLCSRMVSGVNANGLHLCLTSLADDL